jgi:YegS/Rv2252/BmrU family lipid kinase
MTMELMAQIQPDLPAATRARRVMVIHNPAAGRNRRKRLKAVMDRLEALGCHVEARETRQRGDAEHFAREADAGHWDVIAAAGGDGTVNEVVNGLVAGPGGVQLAVIPMGTANVLALEIGLNPRDADAVARTIAHGRPCRVHLGEANGRRFVLMAGAGLDAHVVEGVSTALKRHTGKFAYVVESLRQALGYDFPSLRIIADGREYAASMVVACKGRYYGGPFVAAPDARLDQPRLEVCILPRPGLAGMLRYGLALPLGKLSTLPEVEVVSATKLTVIGPRGAPLQGDGDILARLPAEIAVAKETVELMVPA